MPRASSPRSSRSSRSSVSYKSATTFRPTLPPPPPPKPSLPLPPPVVYSPPPQAAPSFAQSVKEGFSFGVGAAVARNVVDGIANKLGNAFQQGPGTPRPFTSETVPQGTTEAVYQQCLAAKASERCGELTNLERTAWIQCMKESKFDDRACDHLFGERSGERFFT